MVNVRPESAYRLNVLLTEDREHATEHWTQQLPRLLEPQGIHAVVARTGRDAVNWVEREPTHLAVVDLLTPRDEAGDSDENRPGGLWLLEMLRRLPAAPPVVVVSNKSYSLRQAQRFLNEALRLGAFSVVNRPVQIDTLLQVVRRLLDRRYAGGWPGGGEAAGGAGGRQRMPPVDEADKRPNRFNHPSSKENYS